MVFTLPVLVTINVVNHHGLPQPFFLSDVSALPSVTDAERAWDPAGQGHAAGESGDSMSKRQKDGL